MANHEVKREPFGYQPIIKERGFQPSSDSPTKKDAASSMPPKGGNVAQTE